MGRFGSRPVLVSWCPLLPACSRHGASFGQRAGGKRPWTDAGEPAHGAPHTLRRIARPWASRGGGQRTGIGLEVTSRSLLCPLACDGLAGVGCTQDHGRRRGQDGGLARHGGASQWRSRLGGQGVAISCLSSGRLPRSTQRLQPKSCLTESAGGPGGGHWCMRSQTPGFESLSYGRQALLTNRRRCWAAEPAAVGHR
ncbi:hypothetical protein M011DRAFT_322456 [Sporormia fimetaria CBS 119925]|uniref:Uncharacterized protein n=1 Tax=Sporormia fimetaria CBS 119925 TaxID=1340428 RepID=A0A6A6VFM4_9PLEO|nr:hypothetical protein M011DRAFT_322456 [Sporormia fimetaria CBS 119925]